MVMVSSIFLSAIVRQWLTMVYVDMGKVFLGVQVPPAESTQFNEYLGRLGYQYVEETDNVVYKSFLC